MKKAGRKESTALFSDGTYDIEEFHQRFLQLDDPTEYLPALEMVGNWLEWVRLKRDSVWFRTKVREWLEELELKQRSESIAKVRELAKSDKASAYQANKWIAERRYAEVSDRGRPSKKVLAREAKDLARETTESKEEAARVEKAILSQANIKE